MDVTKYQGQWRSFIHTRCRQMAGLQNWWWWCSCIHGSVVNVKCVTVVAEPVCCVVLCQGRAIQRGSHQTISMFSLISGICCQRILHDCLKQMLWVQLNTFSVRVNIWPLWCGCYTCPLHASCCGRTHHNNDDGVISEMSFITANYYFK